LSVVEARQPLRSAGFFIFSYADIVRGATTMRRPATWFIATAVALAGVLGGWYEMSRQRPVRADKPVGEPDPSHVTEIDARIDAMAKQHHALVGWEDALRRSSSDGVQIYTVDVQQVFTSGDKKPIVFLGSVDDIRLTNGKTMVRFLGNVGNRFSGDAFDFDLECDSAAVSTIRADHQFLSEYAVVAAIDTVETHESDEVVDGGTETVRQFLSRGRCLTIMPVDFDYVAARDKAIGGPKQ
jgi:hypothetical protein